MTNDAPLISVRNLERRFHIRHGLLHRQVQSVAAVNGVSFEIGRGETVGLIGESGSGKTTIGRLITGLDRPDSGSILFEGEDILRDPKAIRASRTRIQMVPQDSSASLNPRRMIGRQIADPMLRLGIASSRERAQSETLRLLRRVGLSEADAARFPHEFSGGQRQRINIARTLGTKADFLILDEPTSALDVSIQARILDLLRELQAEYGLTYLFIGHNLAVIQSFCDRVMVLDKGQLVDDFASHALGDPCRHAATQRLVEAVLPIRAADRHNTSDDVAPAGGMRSSALTGC